jgi:hypothetical protein
LTELSVHGYGHGPAGGHQLSFRIAPLGLIPEPNDSGSGKDRRSGNCKSQKEDA